MFCGWVARPPAHPPAAFARHSKGGVALTLSTEEEEGKGGWRTGEPHSKVSSIRTCTTLNHARMLSTFPNDHRTHR